MPVQSKVARSKWTAAQLAILNKFLPEWLENTGDRADVQNRAWEEIQKTLDGFEGVESTTPCVAGILERCGQRPGIFGDLEIAQPRR